MREHDARITETGVGAFHFEMTFPREDPRGKSIVAIAGELAVGTDNHVAKVIYRSLVSGFVNAEINTVMEFSNYGAPVKVQKP
jgi:hypothetical protein